MTGAASDEKSKMRLRAEIHVTGCGTDNCLQDTYNSTVIAAFVTAFAEFIAANRCRQRSFEVELTAMPATISTKAGTFDELEWRNVLIKNEGVELRGASASTDSNGIVQARYSFLLVRTP
jgi:hypothetical protein